MINKIRFAEKVALNQIQSLEEERSARERHFAMYSESERQRLSEPWRRLEDNVTIIYNTHRELLQVNLIEDIPALKVEVKYAGGPYTIYLGSPSGVYYVIPSQGYGDHYSSKTKTMLQDIFLNKVELQNHFDAAFCSMRSHSDFCKHPSNSSTIELIRVLSLYRVKENKLRADLEQNKPLKIG